MKTDQELKQKFEISINKEGIINLIFLIEETDPESSVRLAELVEKAVLEIINKDPEKKHDAIVDLSPLKDKVSYLSSTTRKLYSRIMARQEIKNVAIVTPNVFYKAAINLIIKTAGKEKSVNCFTDKEEAVSWFKNRSSN
ncbi:hypothetical protein ACFL11_01410 [Patescibacteria group bacterium]